MNTRQHVRPELGVIPKRLRHLPIDSRGYPVPWFVEWIDGEPEFRVMSGEKFQLAIIDRRCWVCGGPLGRNMTFVAGPMCLINHTSPEPPSHHGCAEWSAKHCPFLSRPKMERREDDQVNAEHTGDGAIRRNPGCTALVTTRGYTPFKAPGAATIGWLIAMGEFEKVEWYAEGRQATRAEVAHSVETGLPLLEDICRRKATPETVAKARVELRSLYEESKRWWPDAKGGE